MNTLTRLLVLTLTLLLCCAVSSHAALAEWSNASGDCLWTNPANWVGSTLPAPGDDVLIPAGAHVTNI